MTTDSKLAQLKALLQEMGTVLVAYSGGVDSTFLAAVSSEVLGDKALAVFASPPRCPPGEREEAAALATRLGFHFMTIATDEMGNAQFLANTPERCYFCKQELFQKLKAIARSHGTKWIADGTNYDDLGDYRPGRRASRELDIRSPLCEVGLTKAEIRHLSRDKGLPTWDRPASPCLASRIPYGTPVTEDTLRLIFQGETYLRSVGLRELRRRHHGDAARLEVSEKDIPLFLNDEMRRDVVKRIKALGYTYVTLDLAGYRSGSLNEVIAGAERKD